MWLSRIGQWLIDKPAKVTGYVYVHAGEDGPLAWARPGSEIRNPQRGKPWIVVHHELSFVTVGRWPGRLWFVEIIDAATRRDQESAGGPPTTGATYTRAVAVRVDKELPASMLFGEHGEAVCMVINAARQLTLEQAKHLSAARHPYAGQAYDRAFRAWFKARGLPIQPWHDNFDGTLAAGGDRSHSPIYSGLMVVHNQVSKRAVSLSGDTAYEAGDDDDAWLVEPWRGTSTALLDAALALGAPELVGPTDGQILTSAWASLRG